MKQLSSKKQRKNSQRFPDRECSSRKRGKKVRIEMTQQDVLDFLASCQDTDVIDEKQTCYTNIISKTYKFKNGKDLAIAAEWGKNFSGDEYMRPSQLAGWQRRLLDECEALQPDRWGWLKKSEAVGKLPSIGF